MGSGTKPRHISNPARRELQATNATGGSVRLQCPQRLNDVPVELRAEIAGIVHGPVELDHESGAVLVRTGELIVATVADPKTAAVLADCLRDGFRYGATVEALGAEGGVARFEMQ